MDSVQRKYLKVFLPKAIGTISEARRKSEPLFQLLLAYNVNLIGVAWDGRAASLPDNEAVLVRLTTGMEANSDTWETVGDACFRLGHVPFYRMLLIGNLGMTIKDDGTRLLGETRDFLTKNGYQPL